MHFNKKLGHTRSWVEQTYGQWLNTWRVIGKEKRPHYTPQKVRDIVVATAILHNFEIRKGLVMRFFYYITITSLEVVSEMTHKTTFFFRKPMSYEEPDFIEINESEYCSIADGIREAVEIIQYYL